MLVLADILFAVFHAGLVVFNLIGWIWRKTRRLHLVVIGLTWLSWIGLGFVYGFGYCPCTDWHWQVKRDLGQTDLPLSYVKYYVDRMTGLDADPQVVDLSVAVVAFAALAISVVVNVCDLLRRRRPTVSEG